MKVLLLLDTSLLGSASHSLCTFCHRNHPTPPPQLWCSADDLTAEVAEKAEAIAVSSHPQPNSAHHLPLPQPSSHQRPSQCWAAPSEQQVSPPHRFIPADQGASINSKLKKKVGAGTGEEERGGWTCKHPPKAISFWNIAINHNREKTLYFFISEKNSGRNIKKKKKKNFSTSAGEQVELSF